jgi:predicted metal-dependent hydrolase
VKAVTLTAETAVATYGTRSIPYRIERGRRRVSVAVVVDPVEGVILRVPLSLERDRIAAVVRRKGAWIVRRLRGFEDLLPPQTPREFVSGETFLYLGRQYRLRVEAVAGLRTPIVALARGRLLARIPRELPADRQGSAVRAALTTWYRRRATALLPRRLAHWAESLRMPTPPLLIREPPKRWGSCDSRGNVRINWRVIQVAPRLVDYVLAHELVHLEHCRHDSDFWARLGEAMHDADARRTALRRAGRHSTW